jgi:hypothetical protein
MKLTMSPHAQRVAIAEYLGAKWWPSPINPEQSLLAFKKPTKKQAIHLWGRSVWELVPDYVTDLNAMHAAEQFIAGVANWNHYIETLGRVCGQESAKRINRTQDVMATVVACATAAQRAEAFLRTIGKWDDTK